MKNIVLEVLKYTIQTMYDEFAHTPRILPYHCTTSKFRIKDVDTVITCDMEIYIQDPFDIISIMFRAQSVIIPEYGINDKIDFDVHLEITDGKLIISRIELSEWGSDEISDYDNVLNVLNENMKLN